MPVVLHVDRTCRIVLGCSLGAVDSLVDIAGTTVVGSNDEVPVAEDAIEVAQIAGSCITGFCRVTTLVDQRVDLQTVLTARCQHELPQTCGTDARYCFGVQCRLDDGQVLQFQRHVVGFQCLLKNRHVEVRGAEHQADRATQTATVTVDELANDIVICHLHDGRHTTQSLNVFFTTELRINVRGLAVAILIQIGLCHVEVHQRVQIVGHCLREVDDFLIALLVGNSELVAFVDDDLFFLFNLFFVLVHDVLCQHR